VSVRHTGNSYGVLDKIQPEVNVRQVRHAVVAVVLLLAVPAGVATGQGVFRIAYLSPDSGPSLYSDAFRQGLRDLGWVEGKNIAIEYWWADQKRERLPALARELVRRPVDLILASTTQAALAAKSATKTVPIVIPVTNDPIGSGLVKSLARPGGNLTGFSLLTEDLVGKRLELLKEVVPSTTFLAVLLNPTNPVNVTVELKETERVASLLGLKVHSFPARDPHQLVKALEDITAQRTDALLLLSDRLFVTERKTLAEFGAQRRLPVMHFAPEFADAGGLVAYGPNVAAMYRRASVLVDKILKGAKPAEMPVEQARQFEVGHQSQDGYDARSDRSWAASAAGRSSPRMTERNDMVPNTAVERTAGSYSLATAAHRQRWAHGWRGPLFRREWQERAMSGRTPE
jgi:putative ABC transport system substrate-binding protein